MLNVEFRGSVATVTLQRPEVRNALSDHLIGALTKALKDLPETTRAVVLQGEGTSFCAGGDLEWMRRAAEYTEEQNEQDALRLAELFETIAEHRALIVARVQGHAFGGGAGLVAACDVAVCAEDTLFSFSEVKLGLVAATISRYVVPKIGQGHARALFSTGEVFGAADALRIGLVHQVAPLTELDAAIGKKLKSVLAAGPDSVHASKLLAQNPPLTPEEGARMLARRRATDEAREGITAFLEKRKAAFVEDLQG